jgi:hypothetical protein
VNKRMSIYKAGFATGAVFGSWHACWIALVAVHLAQPFIDFVLWAHFIKPVYVVEPFEVGRAAVLLILTASIGFTLGALFAIIWNVFRKA